MGRFATGVTLVTARDAAGRPAAATANAVTSLSLDPPLLLVCLARTSLTLGAIGASGRFAVNLLGAGHRDAARASTARSSCSTASSRSGCPAATTRSSSAAWSTWSTAPTTSRSSSSAAGDDGAVTVALVHGEPGAVDQPLVHHHGACLLGDALGSLLCDCRDRLDAGIRAIVDAGAGVLLYAKPPATALPVCGRERALDHATRDALLAHVLAA